MAQSIAYMKANAEKHREYRRSLHARRADEVNAKRREQRRNDPTIAQQQTEWRKRNSARVRKREREYWAKPENRRRKRAKNKAWYDAEGAAWAREYREKHRSAYIAREMLRRLRNGPRDASELAEVVHDLLERPCVYCGSTENIEIDHIIPVSRGGTNDPANLAPACRPCNRQKWARTPEEWIEEVA